MTLVALMALGMAAIQAMLSRYGSVGPASLALASAVTIGAERALFGRRHRGFWLGFTATGWALIGSLSAWFIAVRYPILKHGPAILNAREQLKRYRMAVAMSESRGVPVADLGSGPNELYLLASALSEVGVFLFLVTVLASLGGLLVAAILFIAKRVARLRRTTRSA